MADTDESEERRSPTYREMLGWVISGTGTAIVVGLGALTWSLDHHRESLHQAEGKHVDTISKAVSEAKVELSAEIRALNTRIDMLMQRAGQDIRTGNQSQRVSVANGSLLPASEWLTTSQYLAVLEAEGTKINADTLRRWVSEGRCDVQANKLDNGQWRYKNPHFVADDS